MPLKSAQFPDKTWEELYNMYVVPKGLHERLKAVYKLLALGPLVTLMGPPWWLFEDKNGDDGKLKEPCQLAEDSTECRGLVPREVWLQRAPPKPGTAKDVNYGHQGMLPSYLALIPRMIERMPRRFAMNPSVTVSCSSDHLSVAGARICVNQHEPQNYVERGGGSTPSIGLECPSSHCCDDNGESVGMIQHHI
jgi:hypothetical protein